MADPEERPSQSDDANETTSDGRQCAERTVPDTMSTTDLVAGLRSIKHKSSNLRTRPHVKTSHTIPSQSIADRPLSSVFSSPTRPKSTPFPLPPSESTSSSEGTDSRRSRQHQPTEDASASSLSVNSQGGGDERLTTLQFSDLPTEILEAILDYVFGFRDSASSKSTLQVPSIGSHSWTSAMRYARRKDLINLATVNSQWKYLIQQRLFRHVKLRGTVSELNGAIKFLSVRDTLRGYVQHLEIWFPVFYHKTGLTTSDSMARGMASHMASNYLLPSDKCSLEDVFRFVALTLPSVRCLTLEGGERRKAPKINVFNKGLGTRKLTSLDQVETLIMKGQWNLARDNGDFANIITAIPNLRRLYSSYSRGKSKSYLTVANYLPLLPQQAKNINDLRLCLEVDGRKELMMPQYAVKAARQVHICESLSQVASTLEHFSYTGRLCHVLFDRLARLSDTRNTRLQTIDITVKNCCRGLDHATEGTASGLEDMGFMMAFERLVLGAIRSLATLAEIRYLRIRFVDLGRSIYSQIGKFSLTINQNLTSPSSILSSSTEMANAPVCGVQRL